MSVTVTIRGNREFCDQAELTAWSVIDCYDCERAEDVRPDCLACQGTGKMKIPTYPYELNFSNGNWSDVASSLGLDALDGECWGAKLQKAISVVDPESLVTGIKTEGWGKGAKIIAFGRTRDQVRRYFDCLSMIAAEATKREEMVVWS